MKEHSAEHSAFEVDKKLICFKNKRVKSRDTREVDWDAHEGYAIACLKALWAEGLSTAEIGRRMGISKNAVTGKAHRLNLSARPSPIRRDAAPVLKPERAKYHPEGPLKMRKEPADGVGHAGEAPAVALTVVGRDTLGQLGKGLGLTVPAVGPEPQPRRVSQTCRWPIGEPRTPEFRFCEEEPAPDKPYCPEHAAIAYVKPRGDAGKKDVA